MDIEDSILFITAQILEFFCELEQRVGTILGIEAMVLIYKSIVMESSDGSIYFFLVLRADVWFIYY